MLLTYVKMISLDNSAFTEGNHEPKTSGEVYEKTKSMKGKKPEKEMRPHGGLAN